MNLHVQKRIGIVLATLIVLIACSTKANNPDGKDKNADTAQNAAPIKLKLPTVPTIYNTPELRAKYLAQHYWDHFNFNDTSFISHPDNIEQALTDYIYLFPQLKLADVEKSIQSVMVRIVTAPNATYKYFNKLLEQYLHDPNSPYRNEDYYIPVLESIVNSTAVDEVNKIRPRDLLNMAKKNRPGMIAADFDFTLPNGKHLKLSQLKSPGYSILYFNNPDCHDCVRVKNILEQVSHPNYQIIAIYPDEEVANWRKAKYPTDWLNGSNLSIRKTSSYDLRAIPCLYLLDKNHRVVLKDVSVEVIVNYIQTHP
jgi:glutaredoxin